MSTIFPFLTATDARSGARNNIIIFSEIRTLQTAILDSIDSGLYSITIDYSYMTNTTNGISYYNSWIGSTISRELDDQMSLVIKFFTDLGYSITQVKNTTTNTTFNWEVYW